MNRAQMHSSFVILCFLSLSTVLPTTTQETITPPTPGQSTGVLEGERVQIRFSDQLPVAWVFPKTSPTTSPGGLSGKWFYFKPAYFHENECLSYRKEYSLDFWGELLNCSSVFSLDLVNDKGWLQEELTEGYGYSFKRSLNKDGEGGNATSLTIQYILLDENGSNVTMRNAKGTERVLNIGSHAVKMNILWDNWTSLAPQEETSNASKTTYPQFSLVFEMGFSDVYEVTELLGVKVPGLVSIDKGYFRSLNVSLNEGEWTVKMNLANFTVSDPPAISSLVREEEEWGFEQVNIDYLQVLLLSNRTFSFIGNVPAAKSVLYDPDFTVLVNGEGEDQRSGTNEDDDEWFIPVVVLVPLSVAFVVVFISVAAFISVHRSHRAKLNESSSGAVNFE